MSNTDTCCGATDESRGFSESKTTLCSGDQQQGEWSSASKLPSRSPLVNDNGSYMIDGEGGIQKESRNLGDDRRKEGQVSSSR